ncbi:MAG TPA: LLM class F420-dependent oxidoreductase [Dehalococcoidia bacterium]|nr:LLM class F420-dependent oxidoreductase [Dehalococcoidia bacterium]
MQYGAIFPQTEIGADPIAVRDWAQAVEGMGYSHILVFDHVLGAATANRPGWTGPYTSESLFHEVFVLLGYLAALTQRVELVTDVLVLPQRQTALVAKQAAEIDVLSAGRLRLGIGTGWNAVEYEALGESFRNRGVRSEEQLAVLRALWSQPVVTFRGRWHTIEEAGINPLPPRRYIPLWLGGGAEAVLQRVGRLADGWFPLMAPDDRARAAIDRLRGYAAAAGRPWQAIGIEPQLGLGTTPEAWWAAYAGAWNALGATHLSVNTMGAGLSNPGGHVGALDRVKLALGF